MFEKRLKDNYIIKIVLDIDNTNREYLFNIKFDKNKTINKAIIDFMRLKNYKIHKNYYYYLRRNNTLIKELDKYEKINEIDIRTGDYIIVSNRNLILSKNKINIECYEKIDNSGSKTYLYQTKKSLRRSIENHPSNQDSKKNNLSLKTKKIIIISLIG